MVKRETPIITKIDSFLQEILILEYAHYITARFRGLEKQNQALKENKRPMGLDALLKSQSSKSCTYTLCLTQDVEIEHIFSMGSGLREKG